MNFHLPKIFFVIGFLSVLTNPCFAYTYGPYYASPDNHYYECLGGGKIDFTNLLNECEAMETIMDIEGGSITMKAEFSYYCEDDYYNGYEQHMTNHDCRLYPDPQGAVCDNNYYQRYYGDNQCFPCPANYDRCYDTYFSCQSGYYKDDDKCIECPSPGTSTQDNTGGIESCYLWDDAQTDSTGTFEQAEPCYYVK